MIVPFRSLLVFEAVTRNSSFTKAAEELNVSQSAISHQIRNLEDYFGARLLDRTGPGMKLTEEGEILYKDLSAAMAMVRRGVSNLKARTALAPVGISVRPHFDLKWLSPHLAGADFEFDFRFYHSNEPADFSNSDLHLSIEWLPREQAPENARLLVPGNLTPACHPSLLEGIDNSADPLILSRFSLLHETNDSSWREWLALAGVPDLKPARAPIYDDTNVRQRAAAEKHGFALVCPALIKEELAQGELVCPFSQYLDRWAYYLIVPEDRLGIRRVRAFVDWLTREI